MLCLTCANPQRYWIGHTCTVCGQEATVAPSTELVVAL